MDALENIMTRRSIRNFTSRRVSDNDLEIILKAAMSGPTCANSRQWTFIVARNKDTLEKMADANGRPATPLRNANVGILVCGDLDRAFKPAPDYWIIDCSIATQNIVLAAHALGIGSVWLGTYPQMDRVDGQSKLFGLPKTIIPHSIIALGYPDLAHPGETPSRFTPPPKPDDFPKEKGAFEPKRVHLEMW